MKNKREQSDLSPRIKKAVPLPSPKADDQQGPLSDGENLRLIHQLEIHQAELEKQREELIKARAETLQALEKYSELYDFSPSGFLTLTREGNILEINLRGAALLGQDRARLRNVSFAQFVTEASLPLFQEFIERVYSSSVRQICEITLSNEDRAPLEIHLAAIVHQQHNQCLMTMVDITAHKLAEQSLRRNEALFKSIFNTSPDLIAIVDTQGVVRMISPSAIRILGLKNENDILGHYATEFVVNEDIERAHSSLEQLSKGIVPPLSEYRVMRTDGKVIDIELNGEFIRVVDEIPTLCLFIIRDITGRKEVEREIKKEREKTRQSEKQFKMLIDRAPVPIYIQTNYRFSYVNQACLDLYGASAATQLVGHEITERIHPAFKGLVFQRMSTINTKKVHVPLIEYKHLKMDGSTIDVEVSATPVIFHNEEGAVVFVRDITFRKAREQELINARNKAEESDRLKSAFLANMSHEIRTPMNGILGFTELLKRPELTGEKKKQYIAMIEKGGARMLNIINDLIDISKIESGQTKVHPSTFNINDQMEYIFHFFKPEIDQKGMQIYSYPGLSDRDAVVQCDREKLLAVLTNLVKNSIKYSDEGSIEMGYALKRSVVAKEAFEPAQPVLEFFVRDTGIGIPEDKLHRIFDRFTQADSGHTRAFQGAGLGLAISKAYVEMMGGRIWVESKPGKGSAFYFLIPYRADHEVSGYLQPVHMPVVFEETELKLKVLIAEDDESSAMLQKEIIQRYCRELIFAGTGLEAIEQYRKNPDLDLILMDIQMPEMDGYEATRQIRALNPSVVIMAQTAYGLTGDREKALQAGCNDYVTKPLNHQLVIDLIKKYFPPPANA